VDLGAGVRPTTTSFVRALLIPFVASPYKVHLPPHFKIMPVTTFGSLIRHNNIVACSGGCRMEDKRGLK
jgi:hypothetical protein